MEKRWRSQTRYNPQLHCGPSEIANSIKTSDLLQPAILYHLVLALRHTMDLREHDNKHIFWFDGSNFDVVFLPSFSRIRHGRRYLVGT